MGLSWINPLYLAGLLLLAIPLLIHLAQREQRHGLRFPSLMFLERIPRREKRRFELRDRLLLLLRCLLLALLALAFARPLFSGGEIALDPARRDAVILLDRSWSMRHGDQWQRARDAALDLVADKRGSDRIGLLLFDDEAEILSEPVADASLLRGLLARAEPGYRATRLPLAIEQAARLLGASNAAERSIFVISDFQAAAAPRVPRIAPGIDLIALPVDAASAGNAALTSVSIVASSKAAADEFALAVEIANFADTPLDTSLTVTLDGREVARRTLRLEAGGTASETFDRLGVNDDLLRGVVRLGDDALALDNQAYFVYSRAARLPLLIVDGATPRDHQALYLENALRLAREPMFRAELRSADDLRAPDLQQRALVVLLDAPIPAGDAGRALADYVAAGGALLLALGETRPGAWPDNDLLPASRPGARVDAPRGSAFRIAEFAPAHPLTAILGGQDAVDLSLARVFAYRALEPGADDRVLARFDDGGVALLERRVGRGRVLLLATTLDPHWNDLALQPAFLPFVHATLRYLAQYEPYRRDARVGDVVDLLRHARGLAGADALLVDGDAPLVVETPSGRAFEIERDAPLLRVDEPGFYQVHRAAADGAEIALAVNLDPREANPARLDVARFVEDIEASAEPPRADSAPTRRQAAGFEREQRLWYAILALLLALMLIEAIYANRIGLRRSRGPATG